MIILTWKRKQRPREGKALTQVIRLACNECRIVTYNTPFHSNMIKKEWVARQCGTHLQFQPGECRVRILPPSYSASPCARNLKTREHAYTHITTNLCNPGVPSALCTWGGDVENENSDSNYRDDDAPVWRQGLSSDILHVT